MPPQPFGISPTLSQLLGEIPFPLFGVFCLDIYLEGKDFSSAHSNTVSDYNTVSDQMTSERNLTTGNSTVADLFLPLTSTRNVSRSE